MKSRGVVGETIQRFQFLRAIIRFSKKEIDRYESEKRIVAPINFVGVGGHIFNRGHYHADLCLSR